MTELLSASLFDLGRFKEPRGVPGVPGAAGLAARNGRPWGCSKRSVTEYSEVMFKSKFTLSMIEGLSAEKGCRDSCCVEGGVCDMHSTADAGASNCSRHSISL
jgi:hypothetical protein